MNDNCLRKFFSWSANSCYIDSLFVALFHSQNILITDFVNNLRIRDHKLSTDKNNYLNEISQSILDSIKTIYAELQIKHDDDKLLLCNNIRQILQTHSNYYDTEVPKKFYYNNEGIKVEVKNIKRDYITGMENPSELLQYLINTVFNRPDNIMFNTITSINDYNNYNQVSSDVNLINIQTNEQSQIILKEEINNNLYLHSIIVNTGLHYVCYYKCNNQWYYYNDLGTNNLIGTISQVSNDIYNQINKVHDKEIILLYLKKNPEQAAQQQAAQQQAAQQQAAQQQAERDRLAQQAVEKAAADKAERDRLAKEAVEKESERLAKEAAQQQAAEAAQQVKEETQQVKEETQQVKEQKVKEEIQQVHIELKQKRLELEQKIEELNIQINLLKNLLRIANV